MALLIGFLLVRALGCGSRGLCRHDFLALILGAAIGVGLCSACCFLGLLFGVSGLILESLLLLACGTAAAVRWKHTQCRFCADPPAAERDRVLNIVLAVSLGLLLTVDAMAFLWATRQSPQGQWDAWAIWNLHARFLYRSDALFWRDGFTQLLNWSHPDYPLLLPAFIARTWKLLGRETNSVPMALGFFFSFGSAGLMAACLSVLRGARQGLLAGLALAATPALYILGASQYADVPFAFFVLATLACMTLCDHFDLAGFAVLAGAAAALSGWTKNEGLVWFCAFLAARVIVRPARHLLPLLAGAAPVLTVILVFKMEVAPPGDIFGAGGRAGIIERFLDAGRYALISHSVLEQIWNFGPLLISPFVILAGFLFATGVHPEERDHIALRTAALALLFTGVAYYFVYVLHPLPLPWLLTTTLNRLTVQLWPAIVFVVFLAAGTIKPMDRQTPIPRKSTP
jgi:hypothetical protein